MKYASRELEGLGAGIRREFFAHYDDAWQMHPGERFAMIGILAQVMPEVSIEIGRAEGGSLSAIAGFSRRVYTIDPIPPGPSLVARHRNVEFVTGKSEDVLPELLAKLKGEDLQFVLIDGDHSAGGVKRDIEMILSYRPRTRLYVLMHDSFDPDCRRGILAADWEGCPHAHYLELDFLFGSIMSVPSGYGHMAGGLALALLSAEPRSGGTDIHTSQELLFRTVLPHATNRPIRTIGWRFRRYAGRLLRRHIAALR